MRPDLSIEALLAARIRADVEDALRTQLAPLIAAIAALTEAVPPAYVDVATAAKRLGLSASRVRAMCAEGSLPAVRIGRSWRVDLARLPRPATSREIAGLAAAARGRP